MEIEVERRAVLGAGSRSLMAKWLELWATMMESTVL